MTTENINFVSVPNQRIITVKRETPKSDFLGIKNENWQAAARNLTPHAMMLYFYLASNKDNYTFALSPAAVRQAIGMARSTYHDQFHNLVDKGYLVPTGGNHFVFYEKPNTSPESNNVATSANIVASPNTEIDITETPNNIINIMDETQSNQIKESASTFIF